MLQFYTKRIGSEEAKSFLDLINRRLEVEDGSIRSTPLIRCLSTRETLLSLSLYMIYGHYGVNRGPSN